MNGYEEFLASIGANEAQMLSAAASVNFRPASVSEIYAIRLDRSPIHGLGVFASRDIQWGGFVADGFIDGVWSLTGRFLNHSDEPNLELRGALCHNHFQAIDEIQSGEELTVDYRQVRNLLFPREAAA